MLGIGLGAFVAGFAGGYGLRQQHEDRAEAKKDREADRAWRDEQRQWASEDRAFQQSERDRAAGQREAIEGITADVQADFDAAVASGEVKASEFDDFWKQYGLPRMQNELLLQGDIDGAKRLMEWGESEAAIKGGRLFAQSMFLAQSGQHAEALDKVIEAGKVRGYIGDDFDIDEKEEIRDETGAVLGYRVTIRDNDGNETIQDIALEDIPTVIATFANPQAAWESQQATRAANSKREQELDDYETKKEIDARYSGKDNAARTAAIKALRERMKVDPMVDGSVNFDDLPRDQREKLITEEISFANGDPTAPPARMIVDGNSGQPVPMPDPSALDGAPGLGSAPTPTRPGPARPAAWSAPPGQGVGESSQPGSVQGDLPVPSEAQVVEQATQQMLSGKDPNAIAQTLKAVGVDQSKWPAELVRVLGQ
jgi:hypothetical protein